VAKELLDELGLVGFPKTSGNRGVHIYVRIRPEWEFVDVRHAAIGFGRALERRDDGVTTKWWKEERGERVFVDFNQNCRDRTIASAYSLRPIPGAPVSTPLTWAELAETTDPTAFTCSPCPTGSPTATLGRDRRRRELAGAAAAALRGVRRRRDALSPRLPEDAGRAAAGPAVPVRGALGS
jgi:DNA primase